MECSKNKRAEKTMNIKKSESDGEKSKFNPKLISQFSWLVNRGPESKCGECYCILCDKVIRGGKTQHFKLHEDTVHHNINSNIKNNTKISPRCFPIAKVKLERLSEDYLREKFESYHSYLFQENQIEKPSDMSDALEVNGEVEPEVDSVKGPNNVGLSSDVFKIEVDDRLVLKQENVLKMDTSPPVQDALRKSSVNDNSLQSLSFNRTQLEEPSLSDNSLINNILKNTSVKVDSKDDPPRVNGANAVNVPSTSGVTSANTAGHQEVSLQAKDENIHQVSPKRSRVIGRETSKKCLQSFLHYLGEEMSTLRDPDLYKRCKRDVLTVVQNFQDRDDIID